MSYDDAERSIQNHKQFYMAVLLFIALGGWLAAVFL